MLQLLDELADDVVVPGAVVRELEAGSKAGINVPVPEEIPWMKIKNPSSVAVLPLVGQHKPSDCHSQEHWGC